jgi:hypothetical protein
MPPRSAGRRTARGEAAGQGHAAASGSSSAVATPADLPDLNSLMQMGMHISAAPGPSSMLTGEKSRQGSSSSATASDICKTLWIVHPDGRVCLICQVKDSDGDRVFVKECYMKWAYPPDALTKKNKGFVCYYCQRVYQARFKGKFKSIEAFVQACGNDLQLFQIFNHWLNMAVDIMKQNMVHDVKIRWGDEGFPCNANIDFQSSEVTLSIGFDLWVNFMCAWQQYGDTTSHT